MARDYVLSRGIPESGKSTQAANQPANRCEHAMALKIQLATISVNPQIRPQQFSIFNPQFSIDTLTLPPNHCLFNVFDF